MVTWKPSGLLRYEYNLSHLGWRKGRLRRIDQVQIKKVFKSENLIYERWLMTGFVVQPGMARDQSSRHQLSSADPQPPWYMINQNQIWTRVSMNLECTLWINSNKLHELCLVAWVVLSWFNFVSCDHDFSCSDTITMTVIFNAGQTN